VFEVGHGADYTTRVIRLSALLALLVLAAPAAAAPAAPAFALTTLDGKRIDSRALMGKNVLVIRFQASWCKLCAAEAPGIERAYQKYRPRGVELVAVHVQDTEADARAFLKAHGAKNIALLTLLSSRRGVARIHKDHPDVPVYTAVVDAVRRIPSFPGMSVSEVRGFGAHAAHPPRAGDGAHHLARLKAQLLSAPCAIQFRMTWMVAALSGGPPSGICSPLMFRFSSFLMR